MDVAEPARNTDCDERVLKFWVTKPKLSTADRVTVSDDLLKFGLIARVPFAVVSFNPHCVRCPSDRADVLRPPNLYLSYPAAAT